MNRSTVTPSQNLSSLNAMPSASVPPNPSQVPPSFARQNKSLLTHSPTTSDEIALKEAVFIGNTDEVCRILSLPNPPNVNAHFEPRFLMLAAKQGFADIVGMLLRAGAEVDDKASQSEVTPLMAAAMSGHTMTVMVLLKWGADPDAINSKAETALLLAIRGGHLAVVKQLLAHGANPLPSAAALRTTRLLLPLQLARHLGHVAIQEALIAANRMMDQYLTNFVLASLPPETKLIDPGHPTTQQSITPRSLSFIPVQVVSNAKTTRILQFTFSTPPSYSNHFSSVGHGSALDELILLYVTCVDLQDGLLIPPRSNQSTPIYNLVYFNGSHTPAISLNPLRNVLNTNVSLSGSPIEVDESPGFRVFVLGSRLNNGGLNSVTMHSNSGQKSQTFQLFQKLLIGIYRVRVELTALSKEAITDIISAMPIPPVTDTNNLAAPDDDAGNKLWQ